MERLINDVAHLGAPEIFPSMEGRMLVAILAPKAQPGKRPTKEPPKETANA
jgi:translation initiation factor IF-3